MVSTLKRKLLRDLVRMRGQVITIALVVACGVASFVTLQSAYGSLLHSRDRYYHEYRFADLFAHLEEAPRAFASVLGKVDGVSLVQARIVEPITLPLGTLAEPARGVAVSVPNQGEPPLNRLHLKRGRSLDPAKPDEVLVLDAFATANGLALGDKIPVIMKGVLRPLTVVGTALSPEFVMTISPGDLNYDPKRAAVLWLTQDALEAASNHEGAFNDVLIRLEPHVSSISVQARVDELLRRHGGSGARLREKQTSHYMLEGELVQLSSMAKTVPFIFLSVAAFLLNVVLARWISLERAQIATLKALGYSNREVGSHYLAFATTIVVIGAALGVGVGAWLGSDLLALYTGQYFRFPAARYVLSADVIATSVLVSLGAAVLGALAATRRVTRMAPAEAMRPEPPARYRRGIVELLGFTRSLPPIFKMILRDVERRPFRLLLSALGIAMGIGIVVVSRSMFDTMDHLIEVQFHRAMREDMTVMLGRGTPRRAVARLRGVPGVLYTEGLRVVPALASVGQHSREVSVTGHPRNSELRRVLESSGNQADLPERGALLSKTLAEVLRVQPGGFVKVEPREGNRTPRTLSVAGIVDDSFGLNLHMLAPELDRIFHEEGTVNTVLLRIDPLERSAIERRLRELPWVAGISNPTQFREKFEAQSGNIMAIYTFILTLFASIIAVGVVYNNARVTLSQRSRELGSLRVLGFSRAEVAAILFGELAIQVVLAIPLGLYFGHLLVLGLNSTVDAEIYRLPTVISVSSYAYAALVAIGSAVVSALLVRRKIYRLDLIAVLKTRE